MFARNLRTFLTLCVILAIPPALRAQDTDSSGLAAIWSGDTDFPLSFKGTAFHIGGGVYVTASHVLDLAGEPWHIVVGSMEAESNRLDHLSQARCIPDRDICFFRVDPASVAVRDLGISEPFRVTCLFPPAEERWIREMRAFAPESRTVKIFPSVAIRSTDGTILRDDDTRFDRVILASEGTSEGTSGGPVFDPETRDVIGVHIGSAGEDQIISPFSELRDLVQIGGQTVFNPSDCSTPLSGVEADDPRLATILHEPLTVLAQEDFWDSFSLPEESVLPWSYSDLLENTDDERLLASHLGPYIVAKLVSERDRRLDEVTRPVAEYFRAMGDPVSSYVLALNDIQNRNFVTASAGLDWVLMSLDEWEHVGWDVPISREFIQEVDRLLIEENGVVVGNSEWQAARSSFSNVLGAHAFPMHFTNLFDFSSDCIWRYGENEHCPPNIAEAMIASGLSSYIINTDSPTHIRRMITENQQAFFEFVRYSSYPDVDTGKTSFFRAFIEWIDGGSSWDENYQEAVLAGMGVDDFDRTILTQPIETFGWAFPAEWTPLSLAAAYGTAENFRATLVASGVDETYQENDRGFLRMLFGSDAMDDGRECLAMRPFPQRTGHFYQQMTKFEVLGGLQAFSHEAIVEAQEMLEELYSSARSDRKDCYECFHAALFGEDCETTELMENYSAFQEFDEIKLVPSELWDRDKGFTFIETELLIVEQVFPFCVFEYEFAPTTCTMWSQSGPLADLNLSSSSVVLEWRGELPTSILRSFSVTYGGSGAAKLFELGSRGSVMSGFRESEVCLNDLLKGRLGYFRESMGAIPEFSLSVVVSDSC